MFEAADLAQLEEIGIAPAEARRQVALFAHPPEAIRLERPCTVGDGVRVLTTAEIERALAGYEEARRAGRLLKFVPASGAASRMFQALASVRNEARPSSLAELRRRSEQGDANAREVAIFIDGLERFAFFPELRDVLGRRGLDAAASRAAGEVGPLLDALLGPDGLDYASLPKGLIKFHRYADGNRTAVEEHWMEAAEFVADAAGRCRLHLTISPEHRTQFAALLERARPRYEERCGVRLAIDFSVQRRSTDTLAVDGDNRPLRTDDGRLLLRPGGHGALMENLNEVEGDVIHLQNIDNVVPDHLRAQTTHWRRVLAGHLAVVQQNLFAHLRELHAAGGDDPLRLQTASLFAGETLGRSLPERVRNAAPSERRAYLQDLLDRPLRVCGVVRNTGEPGGGPFWVRGGDGAATLQIVESAQVDPRSAEQKAIFASATHFNPVSLACGVRDWRGRPFDLRRFVDPDAVFIAHKSKDGRELKALERPGLWNGAMAGWNTVFLEVPEICFTPVKTVNDLLRPEHQPAGARDEG